MRKNKISKIALLTGLLMINTNTKGFYQCVPKQDWFKKQYNILRLEEKFKTAKEQINNDNLWRLVEENKTSGSLDVGIYKVILKAGDGGSSGRSQDGGMGGNGGIDILSDFCNPKFIYDHEKFSANSGTLGESSQQIFLVQSNISYNACFGRKGNNGTDGKGGKGGRGVCFFNPVISSVGGSGGGGGGGTGGQGGGGSGAYFKIRDLEISVKGGNGAASAPVFGGKGGYIYKYESFRCIVEGENANDIKVSFASGGLGVGGNGCKEGGNGSDGRKSNGGEGGCRDRCYGLCGEKGKDGIAGKGGSGGQFMSSGQSSNSGDGYVKIYKYIG